jgi:exodeoxyribonuclease VII small subunit
MAEKKFSFNAAMQEVEQILALLEKGDLDVDEMSEKVKRATELLQTCKQKLYQTDAEIKAVFEKVEM